ncbi:MAG: Fic family protein [Candidatus Krumholzibacteria bacterium]|nr:Fic family protein [Candidatus Krumholzibacteria bacterium]
MRSLNLNYLESIRLSTSQASTLKKIGEFQGKQALFARQTPEILQSLKQLAQVESSESSNRIEGVTAPPHRVKALVLDATKPQNRSEQEIAGYRDALELIHESAEYMAFSIPTVRQMHSLMYRYLPDEAGQWKHKDNEIVEIHPDGTRDIRFVPVLAAETAESMETFVRNYARAIDQEHIEPLVVIPLTILDFLCVHPFRDGNGRVSRLVTLLLLYHFDYQVGRYISLERIVEESKTTYYEALKRSSQRWHEGEHDPYPWMNYFWGVLLRAYREFEQRVGEIRTTKISKTEQIRMAVDRRVGPFAISDIERECPHISRDMIKLVLRDLRDQGVIVGQGKGRGAKWIRNAQSRIKNQT